MFKKYRLTKHHQKTARILKTVAGHDTQQFIRWGVLGLILLLGLFINHIGFDRLPPGEDDMSYLGTVRRTVDFNLEKVTLLDTLKNPTSNTFLFYSLGYFWQPLRDAVDYFTFFNGVYFLFYLGAFVSFLRLTSLVDNQLWRKVLVGLWFVLLISNTFWLGPRYFVPSLWLYISLPNTIVATFQRRWWEILWWTVSNYLFYWFGFGLGLMVFLTALFFQYLKKFSHQLLGLVGILGFFYLFGLKIVGNILDQIDFQSVIIPDIAILDYLFASYAVILLLILLSSWIKHWPIRWHLIFVSLLLTTVFYSIISAFPNDTASYRLIVLFYTSFALLFVAMPSSFIEVSQAIDKGLQYSVMVVVGALFVVLISLNLSQNQKDFQFFAIRPEEVDLFKQINTICPEPHTCLVATDVGTSQLGSYFVPFLSGQSQYAGHLLRYVTEEPARLIDVAHENNNSQIVIIMSKRTTQLYDISLNDPTSWISRSYFLKNKDPLTVFTILNQYQQFLSFANYNIGLYAYTIPVSESSLKILQDIE